MKTTTLVLPLGQGKYYLMEQLDPEDGELEVSCQFWTDDEEDRMLPKYSNLTSFSRDMKAIVERDGWNYIPASVKGVLNRHPLLFQMITGEYPDSIKIHQLEL